MNRNATIAHAMFVSVAAIALCVACSRRPAARTPSADRAEPPRDEIATTDQVPPSTPIASVSPVRRKTHTTYATWYDVPATSLAARRAGLGELTAAHDKYRLGTRLRVTHLLNGRSVVVRITDRGVPRGKAPLDLCKQAATELDMIREGTAKVRVEVLPEEEVAGAAPADSPSAAAQP